MFYDQPAAKHGRMSWESIKKRSSGFFEEHARKKTRKEALAKKTPEEKLAEAITGKKLNKKRSKPHGKVSQRHYATRKRA